MPHAPSYRMRFRGAIPATAAMPIAAALLAGSAAAAEPSPPSTAAAARYSLRLEPPGLSGAAARNVGAFPVSPFARWSELSATEQAAVKVWWEGLGPDDEPPYPVGGLRAIYQRLAEAQDQYGARGPLTLHVRIDRDGVAQAVEVFDSPDPKLTQAAAQIALNARWKPARCDGQPCAMSFPIRAQMNRPR